MPHENEGTRSPHAGQYIECLMVGTQLDNPLRDLLALAPFYSQRAGQITHKPKRRFQQINDLALWHGSCFQPSGIHSTLGATMPEGKSSEKDWRELCAAAAKEPDSEKVVSLVHQILRAFDERDQAVALSRRRKQYCGQP